MNEHLRVEVKRLLEVAGLSRRQIAAKLGISRKRVGRLLGPVTTRPPGPMLIDPYERLIAEWYAETPSLRAMQVYQRLRGYGFTGSYTTVKRATQEKRERKHPAYHELEYLPGEEAQVDWLEARPYYGFVYILAWSRYAVVRFYPRMTMEFFLDGHLRAFRQIQGIAHRHRYDNLKSVVLSRTPEIRFNPRFMDFARHYGFEVKACTPGRPNEKGRVERLNRDLREALGPITTLAELNARVETWCRERNARVHRTTGRTPLEALREERLLKLPALESAPVRVVPVMVTKTAFVEFETNRYSVPTAYAERAGEVWAQPESLEIVIHGKTVAVHRRLFDRREKSETPAHRAVLLERTPRFKLQRIHQLIANLGPESAAFLKDVEAEGEDPSAAAYRMFQLLRGTSKETLLSAVREARTLRIHTVKYLERLLRPPSEREEPVQPQDARLLNLSYRHRELDDYDDLL